MSAETESDLGDLEALLDYVTRRRRFDFTGYKRPALMRRIGKRMSEIGCETFGDYEDYLEVHPDEFVTFFDSILINVTSFFRDPAAWEFVADEIVPRIVSGKDRGAPIRVWNAGCASGEEAYTLAMVLGQALGDEAFRERVKVYATDVDEKALAHARSAIYTAKALEAVPQPLRMEYFEPTPGGFSFRAGLRRSLIFGHHDLLKDAPISRVDLLVCRNTLMYFDAEAQSAVIDSFRFALEGGGGYLFLGRAETVLTRSNLFRPLHSRLRVFEVVGEHPEPRANGRGSSFDPTEPESSRARLVDAAFDAGRTAILVVDVDGLVQLVNASARSLFDISSSDLGRPLQDLELSCPSLELPSVIEDAWSRRRSIDRRGIERQVGKTVHTFDVSVAPLCDVLTGVVCGVSISFDDVTRPRQLESALQPPGEELQASYAELRSTNEELATMNEELQTTIEQLQSTNEELETMNEELQSTNDEFHLINEMLNARRVELDQASASLGSVLTGINCGVIVVGEDLVVQIWNDWSEQMWGISRTDALGKHLTTLDLGLPVAEVVPLARDALESAVPSPRVSFAARNRRGRPFTCLVTCSPMVSGDEPRGVIILMEQLETDSS